MTRVPPAVPNAASGTVGETTSAPGLTAVIAYNGTNGSKVPQLAQSPNFSERPVFGLKLPLKPCPV